MVWLVQEEYRLCHTLYSVLIRDEAIVSGCLQLPNQAASIYCLQTPVTHRSILSHRFCQLDSLLLSLCLCFSHFSLLQAHIFLRRFPERAFSTSIWYHQTFPPNFTFPKHPHLQTHLLLILMYLSSTNVLNRLTRSLSVSEVESLTSSHLFSCCWCSAWYLPSVFWPVACLRSTSFLGPLDLFSCLDCFLILRP